ncbi:MAG: PEP-CTERM sorting domain-containing protein [Pseudomonadota bacterium]|nr:PEP-CTERM sorting domain-containing protein [Pseudomonadota bacterium]
MHVKSMSLSAVTLALAAFSFAGSVEAVPLLCDDVAVNHMYVDTSQVSECLGGGRGNINGNPATDAFLTGEGAGSGLVGIGAGGFTQSGTSGTFSLDASLWQSWNEIAVGFKFGTGNRPDEWFVYSLDPLVSNGSWQFVNVFGRGGGLSHVQLYGRSAANVPEPGTLALLGIGLLGAGIARRRKQA